jgi:hypothetical protein
MKKESNKRMLELETYKTTNGMDFIPAVIDYDNPDDDGTIGVGTVYDGEKRQKSVAFWPDGKTSDSRYTIVIPK